MSKRDWRAEKAPDNFWDVVTVAHGPKGSHASHLAGGLAESDARLIAAAPDMAEALDRAKGELVYMKEKMPHTNAADAFRTVIAALKKAGVIK